MLYLEDKTSLVVYHFFARKWSSDPSGFYLEGIDSLKTTPHAGLQNSNRPECTGKEQIAVSMIRQFELNFIFLR
jgi:hypothetical protein